MVKLDFGGIIENVVTRTEFTVEQAKQILKTVGIVEWILGIFAFISSYLTMNQPYDSPGNLETVVFFGLFGRAQTGADLRRGTRQGRSGRVPAGSLCADRRGDGGDARYVCRRRFRYGGIRRRRGRA